MIFQSQDGCLNSFRTCNLSVVVQPWLMRLCLSQFNLSKFWKHISLTNEHACGNVVFAEDQYLCVWITDLRQTTLLPFILPSSIEAMNVGHLLILVQLFLAIEDLYSPWLSFITRHCINFCCKQLFEELEFISQRWINFNHLYILTDKDQENTLDLDIVVIKLKWF